MTELALDELTRLTEDCVHEPIQAPGAVQPHGTLLAAGLHDGTIVNVGANAASFLGVEPGMMLGRRLAEVLGPEAADDILAAARGPGGTNSVMGVRAAAGVRLDALVHGRDEVAIVELQHAADPGTAGAHLHRVRAAIAQLDAATSPTGLFAAAVEAFRELTGYDRVMVYRFDADGHGQVVAESRRDDLEAFLGLHYPASDIPAQARALMLEQPLRVIVDVDYEPQAVTPVGNPYTGRPLDLGRALLRSVAPVHLQYLRNMGSAATLTVALVRDGRLWGMVAAHHMTPYPVSIALGEGCRLFADVLAHRIGAAEELERGVHRVRLARVGQRLIDAAAAATTLVPALAELDRELLELTGADGAVIRLGSETARVGRVPSDAVVDAVCHRLPDEGGLFVSEALGRDTDIAADPSAASGVLGLRVPGEDGGHIAWFRGELVRTVAWGGDPRKPDDGPGERGHTAPRPRRSFAAWQATVRGQSPPWRSWHVDAAAELGRAVPDLLRRRAATRRAMRDPLTGLYNRVTFGERLEAALGRIHPRGGRLTGVLFIDLDRFKEVNDTLGHQAGDELLVATAARLLEAVRSTDLVARYAGDEFVVLSEGVSDERALAQLAARVVEVFRRPIEIGGEERVVTLSVGYAAFEPGTAAAEVVRRVDEAMYRAKRSGRNRAVGEERRASP